MKPGAKLGYLVGFVAFVAALVFLFLPSQEASHSIGPANTGHEDLSCQECHLPADGTIRQQVQANVRYQLGLRDSPVDFQHQNVDNDNCLACHERETDAHPVFRFNEPRFAEARANIEPQVCTSCHLEHEGVRVTIGTTFCVECHQDLELPNDPLDVPHDQLIADQNWESCLGCHDYHGNHIMEVETAVDNALPISEIEAYFEGALSPYSDQKQFSAKQSLLEETP